EYRRSRPPFYNNRGPSRPGETWSFGCSPTVSALGIRSSKSTATDPPPRPCFLKLRVFGAQVHGLAAFNRFGDTPAAAPGASSDAGAAGRWPCPTSDTTGPGRPPRRG